jgi:CheY-like chemotaxis protein
MIRPCFLVIDREYASSISTRKLVIETAKFNVLTAYSSMEAIETLRRFPQVSGIVIDQGMPDMPCEELIKALREIVPKVPIVLIESPTPRRCDGADHYLQTFDPAAVLTTLQGLEPELTAAIKKQNQRLSES